MNHVSRGAGFDDLDGDGDIDVVILDSCDKPTLLRNHTPSPGHWLQVQLRGVQTNRDGIGAQVRVFAGDLMLLDEVACTHKQALCDASNPSATRLSRSVFRRTDRSGRGFTFNQ
ncbi:MAG: hypothetical protein IIC50_00250 [Planctomycetes bacterium]|nr:hypothetical protein [Planctomycetota bacterium]